MQKEKEVRTIDFKGKKYIESPEEERGWCTGCHLRTKEEQCSARGFSLFKCGDKPIIYKDISSIVIGVKKKLEL